MPKSLRSRASIALPLGALALAWCGAAQAGPPFLTDDPDPTPHRHYEIYLFANGTSAPGDVSGDAGLDFNYGAGPDLQLSATLPLSFDRPDGHGVRGGGGNVELAAKYRLLHQEKSGVNLAVFPRVFLPAPSDFGDDRAAFLLPVWVGRSGETWSTFGGGGCALHRGGDAQDYCIAGWALNGQVRDNLHLGAEIFHETADTKGGKPATTVGVGGALDLSERLHLLGYVGAGLENTDETGRGSAYASVLFTF